MALVSMGAALFLILGAYTFHHEQIRHGSPLKSSRESAFSVRA
ncbi:MAG TPA: hypothetical protein VGF65_19240 [Mycobacterium sp.]|jgi:uncharacterized membrane protein YhiD involved in acid resistance